MMFFLMSFLSFPSAGESMSYSIQRFLFYSCCYDIERPVDKKERYKKHEPAAGHNLSKDETNKEKFI